MIKLYKIKFEKNVGIPKRHSETSLRAFLRSMKVGESFAYKFKKKDLLFLRASISGMHKRNKPFRWITRLTDKGIRVWRVK